MNEVGGLTFLPLIGVIVLIVAFFFTLVVRQYKRCPSNRVLVVYGKVGAEQAAKCLHGGGTFIVPLLQDFAYLSLEPLTIEIDLTSALSMKNIRVNVPSTFTIGISTQHDIMNNAAERLLGLDEREVSHQAQDIILGQMRLVIATLSIEEINQDREKFLDLVNKNVNFELNKIGLEVINVNIRDITDESGYIEAIGREAASEAVNKAKVEVAEADKDGAIGEATANREREVMVANQSSESTSGQKEAERNQRVRVAEIEAHAVTGENESRAHIADSEADLEERKATAKRRGEVARASAERDVLLAEKEAELARLQKEELARQQVEKEKIQVDADAEAERIRRVAQGEADAVLAKYKAEAEGTQSVLEAKASGYEGLLRICGDRKDLAPALLLIEALPRLVAEQVKAIQDLKIDKITVWDGGAKGGDTGATAGFLRGLIGSLPPMHDLAEQAGIDLPEVLGRVKDAEEASAPPPKPGPDDEPPKQAKAAG